jgi:hypothetical protein
MGAAHVEVKDSTTDVFLGAPTSTRAESAGRAGRSISRPRRAIVSSAGSIAGVADALRRCIEIIQATAGGTVSGEPVDVWPGRPIRHGSSFEPSG